MSACNEKTLCGVLGSVHGSGPAAEEAEDRITNYVDALRRVHFDPTSCANKSVCNQPGGNTVPLSVLRGEGQMRMEQYGGPPATSPAAPPAVPSAQPLVVAFKTTHEKIPKASPKASPTATTKASSGDLTSSMYADSMKGSIRGAELPFPHSLARQPNDQATSKADALREPSAPPPPVVSLNEKVYPPFEQRRPYT